MYRNEYDGYVLRRALREDYLRFISEKFALN